MGSALSGDRSGAETDRMGREVSAILCLFCGAAVFVFFDIGRKAAVIAAAVLCAAGAALGVGTVQERDFGASCEISECAVSGTWGGAAARGGRVFDS